MTQRRQYLDQGRGNGRRNSFRPAKVCWVISLSVGLCFAQLSPVLARRSFHSPVVPGYTSPRVARPAAPIRRSVRPVVPVRRAVLPGPWLVRLFVVLLGYGALLWCGILCP